MSQLASSGRTGHLLPGFDRSFIGILLASIVGLYGAVVIDAVISGHGSTSQGHNFLVVPEVKTSDAARPVQEAEPDPATHNLTETARKGLGMSARVVVTPIPHLRPFGFKSAEKSLAARAKEVTLPILISTSADLDSKFSKAGFNLAKIRDGAAVPRFTLVSLPRDLPDLRSAKARKDLFIRVMLPLVLQANEKVRKDRARLLNLNVRRDNLGQADLVWLKEISAKYDVEETDRRKQFSELKRRIDIIPPSLALAQGAEESGWGTSRFAMEGNAVFGQWTYKKGKGIVPSKRDEGKRHEIKSFTGLRSSIASYVNNLNTHWAYVEFRAGRAEARKQGGTLRGDKLIENLRKYSQRGEDYIRTIKTIMRVNGFSEFDRARLQRLDGEET